MSTSLAFWKGRDDSNPTTVYLAMSEQTLVDGIEPVDAPAVRAACRRFLAGWHEDGDMWTCRADADGNGPGAQVSIGPQLIEFTCYGLAGPQLKLIIDAMHSLGYPLFDPQLGERFPTPALRADPGTGRARLLRRPRRARPPRPRAASRSPRRGCPPGGGSTRCRGSAA